MNPIISLVTPVYNTKPAWLKECFDSIQNQTFTDWEWIICDNGSNFNTSELLQQYYEADYKRIKLCVLYKNEGGYKGIEEALKLSTGNYIALLDSDDTLPVHALERIVQVLKEYTPDVLYTDEWIMDENNNLILPFFKPDYNEVFLCFLHYWGHLTVYRSALIKRLGLRHCGGSYDYDLALRASELTSKIYHIPEFLYYYRTYSKSTSSLTRESCMEGGLQTLQQHLDLIYPGFVATRNDPLYKVNFYKDLDLSIIPQSELYPNHLLKSLFLNK